jgi:DNA-binding XRE family transcriptional regulator
MNDLAFKLKEARINARMHQRDLAKKSGVGEKTISSFETGARIEGAKWSQIVALVTACGMTLEEFVTWNPVAEEMPSGPVLVTEDRTPWLQRRYA